MASDRPILDRDRAAHAFLDDDIVDGRPNNRFSEPTPTSFSTSSFAAELQDDIEPSASDAHAQ